MWHKDGDCLVRMISYKGFFFFKFLSMLALLFHSMISNIGPRGQTWPMQSHNLAPGAASLATLDHPCVQCLRDVPLAGPSPGLCSLGLDLGLCRLWCLLRPGLGCTTCGSHSDQHPGVALGSDACAGSGMQRWRVFVGPDPALCHSSGPQDKMSLTHLA